MTDGDLGVVVAKAQDCLTVSLLWSNEVVNVHAEGYDLNSWVRVLNRGNSVCTASPHLHSSIAKKPGDDTKLIRLSTLLTLPPSSFFDKNPNLKKYRKCLVLSRDFKYVFIGSKAKYALMKPGQAYRGTIITGGLAPSMHPDMVKAMNDINTIWTVADVKEPLTDEDELELGDFNELLRNFTEVDFELTSQKDLPASGENAKSAKAVAYTGDSVTPTPKKSPALDATAALPSKPLPTSVSGSYTGSPGTEHQCRAPSATSCEGGKSSADERHVSREEALDALKLIIGNEQVRTVLKMVGKLGTIEKYLAILDNSIAA